jgi:hypothetical protein
MEETNGCLGDGIQLSDFLIEWFEDSLPTLYQQDDIIYEYNQMKQQRSKKSCTIFSAVWAISDLFNYEFSLDEIEEIDSLSYTLGRKANSWWWVQSAVKLVADRWNEHHSDLWKVAYYRLDISNDNLLHSVLDKWYTVMTSFSGNGKYTLDFLADWVLNGTDFWNSTYGHAVNLRKVNWKLCVKDSEKGRKVSKSTKDCNIYELEHEVREIKPFSANGYLYTKVSEDALEEIKRLNELRTKVLLAIETNSAIWHLVNDENYQKQLNLMNNANRNKLKDIENELKKYL